MERLHILDGHGYIFRAFYAVLNERLATTTGMPTGALFVYARMLVRLYLDEHPHRICVVFDAPGRGFRAELDDGYKATRRETPDDLKVQLPYFRPLTEAFRWPVLSVEGVEADDVIATLACRARERGWDVVIYSADKDLMQLVDDHVTVIDAMRQITYDAARVTEKFGVPPAQVRDWLALVGDTSDNIPGVAGIGAKTAAKLLSDHGTIDGILAAVDAMKGKQKERFSDAEQLDRLRLSRELVTLRTELALPAELDDLVAGEWDSPRLMELFEELEFKALVDQLGAAGVARTAEPAPAPAAPGLPPRAVADADELAAFVAAARAAGRVGLHVETDAQRPVRADLVGLALALPGGDAPAIYVPLGHRYLAVGPQLPRDVARELLGPLLADPAVAVYCHDAKSAVTSLARFGVELRGVACDTMLAAYLLDASTDAYELHDVLGVAPRHELTGKGKNARGFDAVAIEQATAWAGGVATAALALGERLARRLDDAGLGLLARDVEYPLAVLLSRVERAGVKIDLEFLRALSARISGDIAALEQRIHELAGGPINVGSPKQLAELLFNRLGLRSSRMRKTKTGYSTDHEVLDAMRDDHPIIAPILEHRELIKLKNTYIDALPPLVNPDTGRVHTSFRQAVAATGRLSSVDPNLQNIPIRTELGREIRRAFIADAGYALVSCDYSQIELRLMAHLSEDPVLVAAFRDGVDIHTQTAAEVFGIDRDAIGPAERRVAKAVNYGLMYGQGEFGLSRALDIPRQEAKHYIERYFARFTRVRDFLDEVIAEAKRTGMSTTVLGRRRPIPDLGSRNIRMRNAAERIARNTPLQGGAADILKLAMLRVQERLNSGAFDARMLLTVHDELLFEVRRDQASALGAEVGRIMESAYQLRVPLVVDVGIADNWADAH